MHADLAIVGMGLSGSRALIELITSLSRQPPPARPLRVAVFDRAGEFGRGIPYGSLSDRRAMLIEDLRATRCPEFRQWVHDNVAELEALGSSELADDRAWHARNAAALAARDLDGLYLPRHVFGTFSVRMLDAALEQARRRGLLQVTRHCDEVLDIRPAGDSGFELETSGGAPLAARHVLLAVGSVPRHDTHQAALAGPWRSRYVCDADACGSFALRAAFDRFQAAVPAGEVRLAIVGAAASAIESLHCAMHHEPLSSRIVSVTTLSGSGMLPGGLSGAGDAPVSEYARLRTSAAEYLLTARTLRDAGRLAILAARLETVRVHAGALRLEAGRSIDGAGVVVDADLVINCSGAGRLPSTPSRLLRNLARKLALRREGRGFATREDHSSCDWPGMHVAGPLLNGGSAASDVESISAVFRVGRELGAALAAQLAAQPESPREKRADARRGMIR